MYLWEAEILQTRLMDPEQNLDALFLDWPTHLHKLILPSGLSHIHFSQRG